MQDKTKITLMALRYPSGQRKVMEILKSTLFASSILGMSQDLQFMVETAQLLPDPKIAARFLSLIGMVRDHMGPQGEMEDLAPDGTSFESSVRGILDEAEREARSGFREDEIEAALAAVDVIES